MAASNDSILNKIRENIVGDNNSADVISLYDLVVNTSNPSLTAQDLAAYISGEEDKAYARSDVSTQIISIATDLPFANFQLGQLIASLITLDDGLRQQLSLTIGDFVASEGAALKDVQDEDRASGYVSLHAFLAHTISLQLHEGDRRVTGLDDALFIVAEGLEIDRPLGVDVAAAAQYFIHAASTLRKACQERLGQDKAASSPIWQSGGPLWEKPLAYGEERWDFWRGRLDTLRDDQSLDEAARKAAALARRAMDLTQ